MKTINRREFLDFTKNLIGSLLLFNICPFSNYTVQAKNMLVSAEIKPTRILVIYASFHGSTAQIAVFIEKKLKKAGIVVEVTSINKDIDFSKYSGIIMGAPIHRGKWMDAAIDFVNSHRSDLKNLPIACFYTCMSKAKQPPSRETLKELLSYQTAMSDLFPDLPPSRIGSFAGALDYDKCSFFTKLVMWSIMRRNNLQAGDYRNWQAIEKWLGDIRKDIISANKYQVTTKTGAS